MLSHEVETRQASSDIRPLSGLDKFSGVLLGMAVGDALGLPRDIITAEKRSSRRSDVLTAGRA